MGLVSLLAEMEDMDNSPLWIQFVLEQYANFPWIAMLLALMLIDILSGIAAAIVQKKLSSKISYRGMMRKASVLLVIGMAVIIEQAIHVTLPDSVKVPIPLAKLTAGFFLINECLSILENARRAGVPLPVFLSKSLSETFDRVSNFSSPKQSEVVELKLKDVTMEAVVSHQEIAPPKNP